MEKRALGKSKLPVSPITLGAWAIGGWMWGGADKKDSLRAIESCLDYGISSIDTAPIYGFGHSEEVLGEAIKGKRDRYEILTKCGMRWEGTKGKYFFTTNDNSGIQREIYTYSGKQSIISECEDSLRRLGTDYIDLYRYTGLIPPLPLRRPWKPLAFCSNRARSGLPESVTIR
jgi:aryl-alcohol dehydrogenase-like predicted oxidoreductase